MKKLSIAVSLAAVLMAPGFAHAQSDYPNRPIKFLLPSAPGGGGDILGRFLGESISKILGQPVIIENNAGASGTISHNQNAKAKPDGYTIGLGTMTASILAPGVNPKLPYDPVKDFTHIARLGTASIMLVVANDFPAKSAPEFINVAKKAKEPIQYGTWGIGSTGHFCSEVLSQKYDFTLSHIVYRGTSPVVLALTSGELQVGFLDSVSGTTAVKSGKVRAIAACTRKMDHMPDVATYKDQGIDFDNWVGWSILGPAGIPDDIAKKLADAFKKTVEDPAMATRMRDWGITPEFVAGPEMAKAAAREIPEWKAIAAKANITIDQ